MGADPAHLRDLAARMTALREAIGGAQARLEAALEAEGRCWGTDATGASFDASYGPASRLVRLMLADTGSGIHELATVLGAVTAVFAAAERDAGRVGA